ncbi:MAG TPA: hypothetical protein VKT78_03420 [Fimbriimonadaceae bacterium]|nr:hypothetical protein [Fimbriimonadaceae bacterium]
MNRRTFVLIVFRTVGVLALFPLARFVCGLLPTWMLLRVFAHGFRLSFPAGLALAIGLGFPIAAAVCGLNAARFADRLGIGDDGRESRIRFCAAITTSTLALLALPTCGELALAGFMRIWMNPASVLNAGNFGDFVSRRLGVNFREIWQLAVEVTALAITAALVVGRVLKAPKAQGDRNE